MGLNFDYAAMHSILLCHMVMKYAYSGNNTGSPGPNNHKTFNNPGQSFNPPCVHSIAIPEVEKSDVNRICAVARGDGVVDVMDVESELGTMKHRNKYSENSKAMKLSDGDVNKTSQIKRLQLDSTLGGHNAAVSSV